MHSTIDWRTLPRFSFGDGPLVADELLALVLSGRKTATCWSAAETEDVSVGGFTVACDGQGRPRAVLETLELTRRRFCDVEAEFAAAEGGGDLSLDHWRRVHRAFFARNGGFSEDMLLWCERFKLVQVIQPDAPAATD